MKTIAILLLATSIGYSAYAHADNCKVTTITQEHNGKVQSESNTVCKEGAPVHVKIKKGDIILENEVAKVPSVPQYFKHNNTKCRMFEDRYIVLSSVMVDHGVICQSDNDSTNWVVLDRW
jgi:hypothetical protein